METITSKSNPLCVHLRKLASSRSYREETGEFLCDSPKLLGEAVLWGAECFIIPTSCEIGLSSFSSFKELVGS